MLTIQKSVHCALYLLKFIRMQLKVTIVSTATILIMLSSFTNGLLCRSSTDKNVLTKKSTGLDVLRILKNENKLAPYVKEGGVAVVTGGNSGIGAVSVDVLALSGMKVVLCARNLDSAKKEVEQMSAKENVRIQEMDLTDLSSVKAAAEEIIEKEGTIDVLLLNAGVMATPYELTKDGFELQFGTNHIAHYFLTNLLLSSINENGRVVSVASTAHTFGDIDFDDLNYSNGRKYTPWGAYGQSKLANILFAKGLNDKLKEKNSNIRSVSLHPGVIRTNLWRYTGSFVSLATNLIADKSVEQGAATNLYCCMVDAENSDIKDGGGYFVDCAIASPNTSGEDADKVRREMLWNRSEEMLRRDGWLS